MVSCVNLTCYYVNLSSQVIQYQEQSNLASPLLIKSKWTNGLGRAHDLWLYLLGLGHQMAFPSRRRYPRQSAIPQGVDDLFIQDGMALFHTITNLPPTSYEICVQILDQTMISIDSYHPGSIKAQPIDHSSRINSQASIYQELPCKRRHKETVMSVMLYRVVSRPLPGWTEKIWQSSLWRVEFINLLKQIARWDCVMLLVLLLHCPSP